MMLSLLSYGNAIIIYQVDASNYAKHIKNRFMSKYGVPEELIEVRSVDYCEEFYRTTNALELCINKKELKVLNSSSSIVQSLLVFKGENE